MLIKRGPDPGPHTNYALYKPEVQLTFSGRCAYCGLHESHFGGVDYMTVDHFKPKGLAKFAGLVAAWTNLYYACAVCNRRKHHKWPNASEHNRGFRFVDCCQEDTDAHIRFETAFPDATKCKVVGVTFPGEYSVTQIALNRRGLRQLRSEIFVELLKQQEMLRNVQELEREVSPSSPRFGQLSALKRTIRADLTELEKRVPFKCRRA